MRANLYILLFCCTFSVFAFTSCKEDRKSSQTMKKVEIKKVNDSYTLYRNGKPYYIKGAAGQEHFAEINKCGGNSVRIWGGEDTKAILDSASKHGLSVMVGLYLPPIRHGFDYSKTKEVDKEIAKIVAQVNKFKDHPAVLIWGIGNELDVTSSRRKDDPNLWKTVNKIARKIHKIDPEHPVTTTIVPYRKTIRSINKYCPDLDILSINSFSALHELSSKLNEPYWGWSKPYLISEWGPHGWWEADKTLWDSPIEEPSTKKAEFYKERYEKFIVTDKKKCLGSYAFFWGQKQEVTESWFSLFDKSGNKSEAIHTLQFLWTGEEAYNYPPRIDYMLLDEKSSKEDVFTESATEHQAKIYVQDIEGDEMEFEWYLKPENQTNDYWGENEIEFEPFFTKKGKDLKAINFTTPEKEGAYRLYCKVYDGNRNYATANFPFYVLKK